MAEPAQYLGTGKRKTSVARVILRPGDGKTWFNGRTLEDYFPRAARRTLALAPLKTAGVGERSTSASSTAAVRPGRPAPCVTESPLPRRGRPGVAGAAQARGLPHPRRPRRRAQEGRPHKARKAPQFSKRWARRAAPPGTDGVRGVVGEDLTVDLVERLGKASTL